MNFEQLEILVRKWADDKGITDKSTGKHQFEKLKEEVIEAEEAIESGNINRVKDEMGDIIVTAINTIYLLDKRANISECLEMAYNKINDRKGKMSKGKFVKE